MAKFPKVVAAVLLVAALAAAATPWRIPRATVADALGGRLGRAADLHAAVTGRVTFKLLPRPRIQALNLAVTAEDGAILLDSPLLKAELDIPSLLKGRWRMTSATLVEPTMTVDLDRVAARHAGGDPGAGEPPLRLRLRAGVLRARSSVALMDDIVTGIDATVSWTGDTLAVSGTAAWRSTPAQFTATLQHPADSVTETGSPAMLQIESPLLSVSAAGVLAGDPRGRFTGHASLVAPSLPRLLRKLDADPLAIGAGRAQISGDLVARFRDLSLSNALVRLDRARFEGTLAWRRDAGRSLLAGTLATDLLDLDALVGDRLDRGAVADLYRRPLDRSPFGTDIDLRISATHARLGRVVAEDAAMAALVTGDRMEVTLDEAQAYGGTVKARALATLGPEGIDAHAEVSAKHLDLAGLSGGLTGRERVGGLLTGRADLDGRGASFRDVVASLDGSGHIGVEGGRLAGLSLAQTLRRIGRRLPPDTDRRGTPTTFDRAQWDVAIKDGTVRIPDGKLTAPGVALSFGARTDLPDGRIDVHAVAAETDGTGTPLRDGPSLPFDMRGFWAGPLIVGNGGLPALPLHAFDPLAGR